VGAFLAGSPLLRAQHDPRPLNEHKRALGINEMINVWDFEAVCHDNVPLSVYDYTAHGDGTEWTMQRNRQAFEWVDLVPGKAVDPKSVNLATQVYDTKMSFPLMISPSATMVPLHPDGEAGCYRGATAAGIPMVVTVNASLPIEKVAAASNGTFWWQLYGNQDIEQNREPLERAQAAGAKAIVITVDQQASYYPRTQQDRNLGGAVRQGRAGGAGGGGRGAPAAPPTSGPGLYRVSAPGRLWYNWQWLETVAKFIKTPIVIKGIVTAEDAQICANHGWGVFISNHGGRSLNYQDSTLEVLPEIVEVVKGRVPVIIDSGVRRGSDVLKALALGANAVSLGRVPRWGLGAYGAPGVQRVLEIVQNELVQAAASAGRASLGSIDRTAVRVHLP
jgi:isopentenyl diphosphate isomerase/L-lactate dehydrogenase-like FMN-dependent dehydrogenase